MFREYKYKGGCPTTMEASLPKKKRSFMSRLKLFYFHYFNSKLITVNIKLEIGSPYMAEVHFSHLQDF